LGIAILSMGIAGAISMIFTWQEIKDHEEFLESYRKDKEILEEMGADTFRAEMEIKETEEEIENLRNRLQICPIFILIFIVFGAFFLMKWRYEKRIEVQRGPSAQVGQAQIIQPPQPPQYTPPQPPQYPPAQPPQYPPRY
jgi:hypothetical protein